MMAVVSEAESRPATPTHGHRALPFGDTTGEKLVHGDLPVETSTTRHKDPEKDSTWAPSEPDLTHRAERGKAERRLLVKLGEWSLPQLAFTGARLGNTCRLCHPSVRGAALSFRLP